MDYGYRGSGTWEGTKEQDGYRRIPITSAGEIKSGDYGRIWGDITFLNYINEKLMDMKNVFMSMLLNKVGKSINV